MSEHVYYERSLAVDVYPHLKMAIDLIDSSLPKVALAVVLGLTLFTWLRMVLRYTRMIKVMRPLPA